LENKPKYVAQLTFNFVHDCTLNIHVADNTTGRIILRSLRY